MENYQVSADEAEKREQVADAIDAARYAHPTHPRDRERPFAEADRGDREYAFRLADAAIAALRRAQPPQQTGASVGEGEASIVNDLDQLYEHGEGVEYGAVMSRVEFDRRVRDKWPIISALLRGRAGDAEGLSEEEQRSVNSWRDAQYLDGMDAYRCRDDLVAIIDRLTGGKS